MPQTTNMHVTETINLRSSSTGLNRAGVEVEFEIQEDEASGNRQQALRDIHADRDKAQLIKNDTADADRGCDRKDICGEQRQAIEDHLHAVAEAHSARKRALAYVHHVFTTLVGFNGIRSVVQA